MVEIAVPEGETLEQFRARFRRAAETAAEELGPLRTQLRNLNATRNAMLREAILAGATTDLAAIDQQVAALRAQIDHRENVLSIANSEDRRLADGEEAHDRRERLRTIKKLLSDRLDHAAAMERAAIEYGQCERRFLDNTLEIWSLVGRDGDGPYLARSGLDPDIGVSAARRAMKRHGAPWSYPNAGMGGETSVPVLVAAGHDRLMQAVEPKLAPKPKIEEAAQ
jgi:hypothetical protein